jgi:putative ABC transport system substrate-binding protein
MASRRPTQWAAQTSKGDCSEECAGAAEGSLIYYCVDTLDQYRSAVAYVDRILRGEKPGDLPVQQPTKFSRGINLKAASALGLTVPLTLLATVDEVVE